MKFLFIIFLILSFNGTSSQTAHPIPSLDKSPMDVVYFPELYPILKIQHDAPPTPVMRVIYSRPDKEGRKIFGRLVDYGEVWRLGANEATEIEFFRDVRINNKVIRTGRYTMYAIPYQDKWTFIINTDTDTWGAFNYSSARDVFRTDIPVFRNEIVDNFTIDIVRTNFGALMSFYWDDVKASVPINF